MKNIIFILLITNLAQAQVFLGLGASSSKKEFNYLERLYPNLENRNENLILVNGNRGATTLEDMVGDPANYFDKYVGGILSSQGLQPKDVTYIWLKSASLDNNINTLTQSQYVDYEVGLFNQVLDIINSKYPNVKAIYLSGRHDGYVNQHVAPRAYYNYLAVQEICDNGRAILAHPFYEQQWGENYTSDGVHPNEEGLDLAVNYMIKWYSNNTDWFTNKVIEPPDTIPTLTNKDHTGFNGENWFEVFNPASADTMLLLNVIPKGEGFTLRFRADKDSNLIASTERLIAMHNMLKRNNRTVYVIYNTDVHDWQPQLVVSRVKELIDNRIAIIAVEADNEYYSKCDYDWNVYLNKFLPIRVALLNAYPTLPFLICVTGRPLDSNGNGFKDSDDILGGRLDHKKWNDQAAAYLKTAPPFDGVVAHIYNNQRELNSIINIPEQRAYNYTNSYTDLEEYYSTLLAEWETAGKDHWRKSTAYYNRLFPGRTWVTEWGIVEAQIRNTYATSSIYYWVWENYYDKYRVFLNHNGMAKSIAGAWYPGRVIDDSRTLTARADAFTYEAFRKGGFINARYLYSSSGSVGWMNERSVAGYEINKVESTKSGNYSFGSELNNQICFKDTTIVLGYNTVVDSIIETVEIKPVIESTELEHGGVKSTMMIEYEMQFFEYDTIYKQVPITDVIQIPTECEGGN